MEIDKEMVDSIFSKLSDIDNRLSAQEKKEKSEPWHDEPDLESPAIWMPEAFHYGEIGGIVVNEGKARESDCKRIALGDDSYLMYSPGVVGALSRDQEQLYCDNYTDVQVSPALAARTKTLRNIALTCQDEVKDMSEGNRLQPFMSCMSRLAKKQGIEI